ncbi:MAG: hypothetical protein GX483_03695 [Actinomycetaceae bacterium]|nr:hypothetical protein [Actinomycetaceae bacterium]
MAGTALLIRNKIAALFAALLLVAGVGMTALPQASAAPGDPGPALPGTWSCTGADCKFLNPDGDPYLSAWVLWNNKWYYLGDDGWMYRTVGEYIYGGDEYIDGSYYRFDSSGAMVTGWVQTKYNVDGKYYWTYYGPDGRSVYDAASYINGAWYVFDGYGFMVADDTYVTEDGEEYRLTSSGKAYTGWYQSGSTWYYYGSDGAMYWSRWLYSGGQWYYFDFAGRMYDRMTAFIDGKLYQFAASGAMITGWYQSGSEWYYSGADGARYSRQWLYYGGKWYFFHGTHYFGNFVGNRMMRDDAFYIGDSRYRFDENGAMLSNEWYYQNEGLWSDGWQYYDASGKQPLGWVLYNGKWYYFTLFELIPRLVVNTDYEVDGIYYRFDANGAWTGYAYSPGN